MPLYQYKAMNEAGKLYAGEVKMGTESELAGLLVQKGFSPIEIKVKNAFTDITQLQILKPRVKIKDLAMFCRQFAIVLQAGVPIAAALDVLREQAQNRTLRESLNDIYENIQKGTSLSACMKQHANIFPELLINMIDAGELSGQLDRVLVRMADHYEKEFKLHHKVKSAMIYPAVVSVVAVLVVIIMLAFVLPKFTYVLKDLKVEMPALTRVVIAVSDAMKTFWWLIFLMLGLVVFAIKRYSKSRHGKYFIASLSLKLPGVKRVTKNVITAKFSRSLSILVSSGVLLIQAMEIVQKMLGNAIIAEKFEQIIGELKKGKGLTQPLASIRYFPPLMISMLKIGEESGNMDFALNKTADFYDQEVETSVQRLTSMLEPMMIILMAVVVGLIVLSVLMPMMTIYQNAGK